MGDPFARPGSGVARRLIDQRAGVASLSFNAFGFQCVRRAVPARESAGFVLREEIPAVSTARAFHAASRSRRERLRACSRACAGAAPSASRAAACCCQRVRVAPMGRARHVTVSRRGWDSAFTPAGDACAPDLGAGGAPHVGWTVRALSRRARCSTSVDVRARAEAPRPAATHAFTLARRSSSYQRFQFITADLTQFFASTGAVRYDAGVKLRRSMIVVASGASA